MEITEEHLQAESIADELGLVLGRTVTINGRTVTHEKIEKLYRDIRGRAPETKGAYLDPVTLMRRLTELITLNRELDRAALPGRVADSVRNFVQAQFDELKIEITDSGPWTYRRNGWDADISKGEFLTKLRLNLSEYNQKLPKDGDLPKLSLDLLADAIDDLVQRKALDFIENLQARIAYADSETDSTVFVSGLLQCYFIQPSAENIAAFKHLIWSIKRKIFNKPIPESLFYCLHSSRQHMGKTTFLRKLCTGFERIHSPNGDLSSIFRATDYKAMCRGKYLLDFQELSLDTRGGSAIDTSLVTTLKLIISTDTISGREMYMASEGVERQTTVLCSSTNKHIWDVINDVSGMRRYWEFNLAPPQDFDPEFYLQANMYFDNILDLYQSINENNPVGYYHPSRPEWKAMRAIQDGYVRENPFLMFLHSKGWQIVHEGDTDSVAVPVRKLVDVFNMHLKERGDPIWTTKHIVWVINANTDISPTTAVIGTKLTETYSVKGWKK